LRICAPRATVAPISTVAPLSITAPSSTVAPIPTPPAPISLPTDSPAFLATKMPPPMAAKTIASASSALLPVETAATIRVIASTPSAVANSPGPRNGGGAAFFGVSAWETRLRLSSSELTASAP